mmetsp:Transcript_5516/g.7714  ORF Transcript_5516/g.7714 Transcript_5516/m.7714 type:complete len:282 (-) Transcript_5516:485-1330(-)
MASLLSHGLRGLLHGLGQAGEGGGGRGRQRGGHSNVVGKHLFAAALNAVAHDLHGQHAEGLLDLDAQLLNAQEEHGDQEGDGDGGQVQIAVAQLLVQGQRQEEQPDGQEARGVPGVHQRHGRLEDALAHAHGVAEAAQVAVDRAQLHVVHVGVVHHGAQLLHNAHGAVLGLHDLVSVLLAQQTHKFRVQLILLILPVPEVALDRASIGNDQVSEPGLLSNHFRGVGVPILGVEEAKAVAHKVTGAVNGETPLNAGIPPPRIGRVSTEDQQQTQSRGAQGER